VTAVTAEPRMEDLLASIRRAIHDDIGDMPSSTTGHSQGTLFKGAMRELRVKAGDDASADVEVSSLRDKVNRTRVGEPEQAKLRRIADRSPSNTLRPSFAEADIPRNFRRSPEPIAPASGFWDGQLPVEGGFSPEPGLLSTDAEVSAGNAFNKLAHTLLSRPTGGQPIEEMTRELLRGMLKQWLDANLPGLVERLVREEIERVARRGR